MNRIKGAIGKITKKCWIISGVVILILISVGVTVWPLQILKKEKKVEKTEIQTQQFVEQTSEQVFTKDNVYKGEYKNDIQSANVYVNNTQEVRIAVVADKEAQQILGDTKKISCGHIAFVTARVTGPAILTNALGALFEDKVLADFVPGNIIPTYHPELTLEKVMIDNGVAKVYLGGNFGGEHDGWCDASLAIAQITETAKTFPNINSVEVYQGGEKIY